MSIAGYIELSDNSLDKTKCPSNDALHKSTIGSFWLSDSAKIVYIEVIVPEFFDHYHFFR